jgi:hypothetical protein
MAAAACGAALVKSILTVIVSRLVQSVEEHRLQRPPNTARFHGAARRIAIAIALQVPAPSAMAGARARGLAVTREGLNNAKFRRVQPNRPGSA